MERKMTQHKVVADDSLAAMDEISRVLGKDAVILKTQKVNGKIEIVGSNNIEDIASSNAKKMNKQKNSFGHLFSNHNLEKDNQIRKYNTIIQNQNIKEDINSDKSSEIKCDDFDKNYVDMETFKIFTTKIENLLKNMIISDIDEFNKNENKSLTIDLLKKGFSKTVISDFQKKISKDKEITDLELFFYHYLAKKLVFPYEEQIINSDVIFLNGPTGSGKTTLCAKISSYILDNLFSAKEKHKLSIINFGPKSSDYSELLNFGKLLNLNVASVSSLNDLIKYIEENKMKTKLLIDVSQENKNLSGYLNYLEKITLNKNCSNLLTIPASSNKNMINSIMNFYKDSFPTIALTKLDESHRSAEELSIFAELNCKIGILSGSRSIIGSIAFAKSEVLAQYMKDITI
jgi:flagellar biosynthesis GTPase FlhF